MKKYWKTVLISLVIVTTIGTYYIQSAMASKSGVSFKIETTSGNKEEIENLQFHATYGSGDMYHELYITKDGSTDMGRSSIIEDLIADQVPLEFEKYIQEHRSFMRGKVFHPSNFFEDDARLIYTIFSDFDGQVIRRNLTLQVDTLDKQTNDSTSFEINVPAQASYHWMDVNDVYVVNGKIKILATGYTTDDGEEMHIYTVDENKKELEEDLMIADTKSDVSAFRIYSGSNKIQSENYYLYKLDKFKNQSEDVESEIISSQMYLYNNSTNEVEELNIPSDLKPFKDSVVIQGVELFIPIHSAKGIELNRYNIEQKQWEEPVYFNYPNTFNNDEVPLLQLMNGKLYLVNRSSDGYGLFIGDLRTGESLYEGNIINENKGNLNSDTYFYTHEIYTLN